MYLVSEDGKSAYRTNIRLGRQNPRYVEILEGLKEGDWVITSGCDTFKEADTLIFKEPLNLEQLIQLFFHFQEFFLQFQFFLLKLH